MSQERTDDEEIIQRMRYNEAKAYQIGHAFSPEMSAALREIDRLNAENEGLKKKIETRSNVSRKALEAAHAEVARLNATIAEKENAIYAFAEANSELRAKAQERDVYIESLTARQIAIAADLDKRDKTIQGQADQIKNMRKYAEGLETSAWNKAMRQKSAPKDKVVSELEKKVQEQDHRIREDAELIKNQGKEIRILQAQLKRTAEERDKEIERLKSELESALSWGREQRQVAKAAKQAWYDALPVTFDGDAMAANMRAEIDRLRAVMEKAKIGLSMIHKWAPTGTHIESYAEVGRNMLDAALKGAE